MLYDYSKLNGRIVEKYKNQYAFAKTMGWSERTCSLKLSDKSEWKQLEIINACRLLDIPETEISVYFYSMQSSSIKIRDDKLPKQNKSRKKASSPVRITHVLPDGTRVNSLKGLHIPYLPETKFIYELALKYSIQSQNVDSTKQ